MFFNILYLIHLATILILPYDIYYPELFVCVLPCKLECKLLEREFNAYLTFYKEYTNVLMNFYNRFYSFYKLTLVFIFCPPLLPSVFFLKEI